MINNLMSSRLEIKKNSQIVNNNYSKVKRESNFKSNNDIFGMNSRINLKSGKHYKKTAQEIVESRIEKQLRVN